MTFRSPERHMSMSTPRVTETTKQPRPVEHDPFIDDLPRSVVKI